MGEIGSKWRGLRSMAVIVVGFVVIASQFVFTEGRMKEEILSYNGTKEVELSYVTKAMNFLWQPGGHLGSHHVWPEMKFGWKIVVGAIIGFFGAAFGTVGGVGGGGIFVPMLTLIIGFDAKSSTAISKCMIMGGSAATVYYNLNMRHPTLALPIIDYDLALLFQPMLMLGISIGVAFNVIFADWMLTVLLIILFFGLSTKAFFKGVETWKKETIMKKEAARRLESNGTSGKEVNFKPLPEGPRNSAQMETKEFEEPEEAARRLESNGTSGEEVNFKPLPEGPSNSAQMKTKESKEPEEAARRMESNGTSGEEVNFKPLPEGPRNSAQMETKEFEESEEAARRMESNGTSGEEVNFKPLPEGPSNSAQMETKESKDPEEATRHLESNGTSGKEVNFKPLPEGPSNSAQMETRESKEPKVSILENVYWKELGLLVAVWVAILALQIGKNYMATCSVAYWVLNMLQIPVAVGVSSYEAVSLYKGRRVIASKGEAGTNWQVHKLVLYCAIGIVAGMVGGLLGLGGGFILGPLFLEMGIPPQVSSATSTFVMMFSSSMSVIEYYLIKRFPVPYALYFFAVATIAALVGQHVVTKVINILGRASLIIFILALTIFVSAVSLGGVGLSHMIEKIKHNEYMGLENICAFKP